VNRSGVEMYDPMSIFWMSFEDMKNYFAVVDVCRVHDKWESYKERAWLPSGVGPGEAFDLTVYERTQVDVTLWQEKHITRESALGASTNVDVGVVVLRKGQNVDGAFEFQCVEYAKRTSEDCVSQEVILEGGYVYRVAPLCFNQMQEMAPRRVTLTVHASNPVTLKRVTSSLRDLAAASFAAATKGKTAPIMPGVMSHMVQERAGYIFAVTNDTDAAFGIQVDSNDSFGYTSSREGGVCGCIDLIPARSRKVVLALAAKQGVQRAGMSFAFDALPAEAAAWAVGADDVHMALPLTPLARTREPMAPDPSVVASNMPARVLSGRAEKTPTAGSTHPEVDPDVEANLAEALRLSLEGCAPETVGGNDDMEEDDELALAIRLSMSAAPSATVATAAPAQSGSTNDVKELFEHHRAKGLAPNEAAAKAMETQGAARGHPDGQPPHSGSLQSAVKALFAEFCQRGMAPNEAAAKAMQTAKARFQRS